MLEIKDLHVHLIHTAASGVRRRQHAPSRRPDSHAHRRERRGKSSVIRSISAPREGYEGRSAVHPGARDGSGPGWNSSEIPEEIIRRISVSLKAAASSPTTVEEKLMLGVHPQRQGRIA